MPSPDTLPCTRLSSQQFSVNFNINAGMRILDVNKVCITFEDTIFTIQKYLGFFKQKLINRKSCKKPGFHDIHVSLPRLEQDEKSDRYL